MENSGKTVELKELPENKIRLFGGRDPIVVEIPDSVSDKTENCPISVSITPMSHREAEVRKRIKRSLSVAMDKSNRDVGITQDEIFEYHREYSELILETETANDEEKANLLFDFQRKWDSLKSKIDSKDLSEYYSEEDRLYENAIDIIANNVVSLNWESQSAPVDRKNVEYFHPELVSWLLAKIEENSYLNDGEVVGF